MTNDKVAKRRELVEKLEQGFTDLKDSDRFRAWLGTCARFHHYSLGNTMLIAIQRPDASRVAGFQTWRGLGRMVRKGEKGIAILAPMTYKKRRKDDDEGEDEDEDRDDTGLAFRTVHVFDVSQTDGDALATITDELDGDDAGTWDALAAVAEGEGLTLTRDPDLARNGANGFYAPDRRVVWVKPELCGAQAARTLAHELGHHFAAHQENGHCKGERETIAESVAFMVMSHRGIDAGSYSFGYLASWTTPKVFKAKLAEIQKAAGAIIDKLEAPA